jgi:hypothetical protein
MRALLGGQLGAGSGAAGACSRSPRVQPRRPTGAWRRGRAPRLRHAAGPARDGGRGERLCRGWRPSRAVTWTARPTVHQGIQSDRARLSGSRGARRRAGARGRDGACARVLRRGADDCAGFWSRDSGQGALAPGAGPRRGGGAVHARPRGEVSESAAVLAAQAEVASVRGDSASAQRSRRRH